ncbi:hypothetical protein A4X13_0g8848 [Tilletia indica]|uniref:Uncharacterized protein n=1 Tax=Tilletia indica TaxID=43049 RepID=A0A177T3A5_9BASI|nr:hypothetical protein A4X13_0g8848 [Tilletia indica]
MDGMAVMRIINKCTTIGHLVYKCSGNGKRTIAAVKKETSVLGKGAWVDYKLKAEHECGVTIDIALWKPRLPSTTSPSSTLPVEPGISKERQTPEHALLVPTLGLRKLSAASPSSDGCLQAIQHRFEYAVKETSSFTMKVGYSSKSVA